MKNSPDNQTLAQLALLTAGVIGGFAPYASKVVLRELPPLTVLFIRISIMLVILLPISRRGLRHLHAHWLQLLILGLLWVGNLILFIVGIQHTTAIASSIIYTAVPILILFEQWMLLKEKFTLTQGAGIGLGLVGALLVIFASQGQNRSFGSLYGNILMFIAIWCYSLYVVFSKRISRHVSPLGLTTGAAMIGWVVSGVFMVAVEGFSGLQGAVRLSLTGWYALLYISLILGVVMYFLLQWGVKYGSALVAGMVGYLGMLVAVITGIVYLGEDVSPGIIVGGSLVIVGVFLTSTLPLLSKRARGHFLDGIIR